MIAPYYQDDLVTLYHGDCCEVGLDWLEADVLVMDPPYGVNSSMHGGGTAIRNDAARIRTRHRKPGIQNDLNTRARDEVINSWLPKPAVVFGSWAAKFPDNKQILIWRKGPDAGVIGSTTGYRRDTELIFLCGDWPTTPARWSSVLTTDAGLNTYVKGHSHAKPVLLMETLVSRVPPGVIADPFAGAGSTLVAAKHLGRRAIGVEIEERYCETAARRLEQGVLGFEESA